MQYEPSLINIKLAGVPAGGHFGAVVIASSGGVSVFLKNHSMISTSFSQAWHGIAGCFASTTEWTQEVISQSWLGAPGCIKPQWDSSMDLRWLPSNFTTNLNNCQRNVPSKTIKSPIQWHTMWKSKGLQQLLCTLCSHNNVFKNSPISVLNYNMQNL